MTVLEQVYEFYHILETIDDSFSVANKPDTNTVVTALNVGQLRYLKDKYLSLPTMKECIERINECSNDLKNIIVSSQIIMAQVNSGPYSGLSYRGALPDNYLHYLKSESNVIRVGHILPTEVGVPKWVRNAISDDIKYIDNVLTSINNKPILVEPVVFVNNNNITLVIDSYTSLTNNGIYMTYLRRPLYLGLVEVGGTVTTQCELSEYLHEDIVRYSVDIFIKEYKYMLQQKSAEK